jgi:hypothetical protein
MLKLNHLKKSLKQLKAPYHPINLFAPACVFLLVSFNAHAAPQADFSLSVNPPSLTINQGASATATVTIARGGGFAGSVTLDAFEALPSAVLTNGITITFNPASTTGNSSVATVTVPSTVPSGVVHVIISGTSGDMTRITSLNINVTGGPITALVTANGPFFNQEEIRISNTTPITALSVTIVIQRTPGLSVNAAFNTVGGQITQSVTTTPTTFVYQFNLASGQTLQPGTNRGFVAQTNGSGTTHPTNGDTATITFTTGGVTRTETRTF